jgi:beta-glucosidase
VLNTGGAVYMPWISQVGAVLEAWYPGEQDGPATAATLFGSSNPSGRLPITFPPSGAPDLTTSQQWPGNGGTVTYSEGLDMGYRWYESQGLQPLFPFGLGSATMQSQLSSVTIRVRVTNTSKRTGSDVVECYLDYPASAGEPPHQLRAFARVTLDPGQSKVATLSLSRSAFQIYAGGQFIVPPGAFTAWVGSSSEDLPISIPVTPPAQ